MAGLRLLTKIKTTDIINKKALRTGRSKIACVPGSGEPLPGIFVKTVAKFIWNRTTCAGGLAGIGEG